IDFGCEEQRHRRQSVVHSYGFEENLEARVAYIGHTGQRLVLRQREVAFTSFAPNFPMDPLRVARGGRKQVGDQEMNAGKERLLGLADEESEHPSTTLVARGNDLNHRDDLMTTTVANHDGLGLMRIQVELGPRVEPDSWGLN